MSGCQLLAWACLVRLVEERLLAPGAGSWTAEVAGRSSATGYIDRQGDAAPIRLIKDFATRRPAPHRLGEKAAPAFRMRPHDGPSEA